jgi:hypothetical protein
MTKHRKYDWEDLYWSDASGDLVKLLKLGAEHGGVVRSFDIYKQRDALMKQLVHDTAGQQHWSRFGRGDIEDCSKAVEFADGTVLVVFTVSQFAGTFQSHDNIHVHWFVGKPV